MSRFTIDLSDNKKGTVWRVSMVNIQHSDTLDFQSLKIISSSDPTYTFKAFKYEITIPNEKSNAVHTLYKFSNGEWSADYKVKKPIEDDLLLEIRNAIIDRENALKDE